MEEMDFYWKWSTTVVKAVWKNAPFWLCAETVKGFVGHIS